MVRLVLLAQCLFLGSCLNKQNVYLNSPIDENKLIHEIVFQFPVLDNYTWKIHELYGDDAVIDVILSTQHSDTVIYAHIEKRDLNYPNYSEKSYLLHEFWKSYIFNGKHLFLFMNYKRDTLFLYESTVENDIEKRVFKRGKYLYLYHNQKLNLGQQNYFLEYTDSLIKIEGDNLPPLPELYFYEKDSLVNINIPVAP